jgi:hypothetical protein
MNQILGNPKPTSIFFFPNGNVAVCDQYGQQMPKYQGSNHNDAVRLLEEDGYDWKHLADINGRPY